MPVTFLAHQAPLFPLRRRVPVDGVAFVAGSVVPDLSAATLRTAPHYVLWGVPTWHDGHRWGELLQWCLPVGLLLTVVVRRLLAPALAPHLPGAGRWNLRDLAVLAEHRHRWWVTVLSVLAGAISHVVLDVVTHEDRAGQMGGTVLGAPLLRAGGHTLTLGIAAQAVVSVVLCVVAYRGFRGLAGHRWGAEERGVPAPPPGRPAPVDRAVLGALCAGAALAAGAAATQAERGLKIVLMTWVWLVLAVAVVVAGARRGVGWWRGRHRAAVSGP